MPRNSEEPNASNEGNEVSELNAAPEMPEGHDEAAAAGAIPSTKQWYIVHTYSGFEKKVKESLESRVAAFGLQDKIGRLMIPTEDVVEVRGGKKIVSPRMLFPGYVLVEMDMDDYTWHVVRSTPKVTGFVGSGQTPSPLSEEQIEEILHRVTTATDKPKPKLVFERNEQVRIVDGPFATFTGVVEEVNSDRSTLKISVTIFGRSTPVELDFVQVEKIT